MSKYSLCDVQPHLTALEVVQSTALLVYACIRLYMLVTQGDINKHLLTYLASISSHVRQIFCLALVVITF